MSYVSHASSEFWEKYKELPQEVRAQADKAYKLFVSNPGHPSVALKRVGPYWSARVSRDYRVLGLLRGNEFFWFWIGTHGDYADLLK